MYIQFKTNKSAKIIIYQNDQNLYPLMERIHINVHVICSLSSLMKHLIMKHFQTVLRIWDCLFYEGSKVILRVALTMLSLNKERLLACRDFAQLCTAMKVRGKNCLEQ